MPPSPSAPPPRLALAEVAKTFTLHMAGGTVLPVVRGVAFEVRDGECVVLDGPSGAGKSTILKMIYGSYRVDRGAIHVRGPAGAVDVATADPRAILRLRRTTVGYVSQFLRAIPRVSALDLVGEAAREDGSAPEVARRTARDLLLRLNLPERLHDLPPATFSGGEQARVNIARGLAAARPLLLLDEPTASLDAANRAEVEALIGERRAAGAAIVAIFHDEGTRAAVGTRTVTVTRDGGVG
jgi:alpha-D-ribose 1-methylphosphonate 5-triphosphate synthase subunit PhnL